MPPHTCLHAAPLPRRSPRVLSPGVSTRGISAAASIPPRAWDSHMHVTDLKYRLSPSATYKPHEATLQQAQENATKLGLPNLVFVQPSTYGNDNRCLLHALKKVGPKHGRGVVVFDPVETRFETLLEWHRLGVRGIRVNFKSVRREMEEEEMLKLLKHYVRCINQKETENPSPLDWALQLFVDMSIVPQLERFVDEYVDLHKGVRLVLDHFGSPGQLNKDLSTIKGWDAMQRIMKNSGVFVKISAPYRLSEDPEYKDLEAMTKELFKIRNGYGVVFASDWPHTRFEGMDIQPWIEKCLEWCDGDQQLIDKLFRDNARDLWDVDN